MVAMPADVSAHDMYGPDERCSEVGGVRFVSVGPVAERETRGLYVEGPQTAPNFWKKKFLDGCIICLNARLLLHPALFPFALLFFSLLFGSFHLDFRYKELGPI